MSNRRATLAHVSGGSRHAVAANLRVLILPDEEGQGFVAQGLDIDYFATGSTADEVRENFATGLLRTVEAYLRRGRPLSGLMTKSKAPREAWDAWFESDGKDELTCVAVVDLADRLPPGTPRLFDRLQFCQPLHV